MTHRVLISKIYKQFIQLKSKIQTTQLAQISRNWHNIVNQLYFNRTNRGKKYKQPNLKMGGKPK